MTGNRGGRVVTFYSYKGGTGRTMALANVAWILAANGKRVLVVDWDLESPGLHRYFSPFIDGNEFVGTGGVIDLIRDYEWATLRSERIDEDWHAQYARVHKHAFSLKWDDFPAGGGIDFLAAGKQDRTYVELLASLNWDNFYDRLSGGEFLDALRADMKQHYDYALIDSRTGLSDIADICTVQMPDILVACFTLADQGIDGAAGVARDVQDRYRARSIRILPVPMRVDPAEKQKADAGRLVAKQRFVGLPVTSTEGERDQYWAAMQVPYQAFYAYEETLATFEDVPGASGTLLAAYEMLTARITQGEVSALPPMPDAIRQRVRARFVRQPATVEDEVVLRYAPQDQVWAEWIGQVLGEVGVQVHDPYHPVEAGVAPPAGRTLVIISPANRAAEGDAAVRLGGPPPLAVYVADVQAVPNLPAVRLVGQDEHTAAESLLRLVGHPNANVSAVLAAAPRFPGREPVINNAPARNLRFTGREDDLRQLRTQLRASGSAAVLPVALQGMGGVGKTMIAAEYAFRFRTAYDVVWWIDADPANFVSTKLSDLGPQLGLATQSAVADNTRAVLQALGRGQPHQRWLLIMDNADDLEEIEPFLPTGNGHVLITSRNPDWSERATGIEVDVFRRAESISHLTQRMKAIKPDDANRIAEALGDLPIAVAAAGAWLAETGTAVDEYLSQIELHGPRALAPSESTAERRVEATWDLSLARLQQRSPAAYRLLQLCSLLAPEIALDLVYGDEFADALVPLDARVTDRLFRGTLVQALNRLTLVKIDQQRGQDNESVPGERTDRIGQIAVHRLLQQVVRLRMSDEEQALARHQIHTILARSRPRYEVDDPSTWIRYRMLWPHLEASDAVSCNDEQVRQLLIDRVRFLYFLGDLQPGRVLAQRIDDTWTARLAEMTDPEEIRSMRQQLLLLRFNLANILCQLGQFQAAHALDSAGLAAQQELLGPEHPHTLLSAGGLARDLRCLGRYQEALELDESTHAAWVDNLGDDHPRSLTALSNLAVSNRLMGRFRTAYDLDVQVWRRRQVVLSENNHNTLQSAGNIGRDLRDAGDFDESIRIIEGTVDTYAQVWGAEAKGALVEQASLCVSLRKAGRAREAVDRLDRVYEKVSDLLGSDSPDTLSVRLSRAVNLLAVDDRRALPEMEAVHEAYVTSIGPTHPLTLACTNNLALAKRAVRDLDEAIRLLAFATEQLSGVLFGLHPRALGATVNLAICRAEAGQLEEAVRLAGVVVSGAQEGLGPDHPDTLRARANDLLIRRLAGEAMLETELSGAVQRLTDRLGENHPAVVAVIENRLLHKIIDPHPF